MSHRIIKEIVCDICGDSSCGDKWHYEISLREYSTVICSYFDTKTIHVCATHEAEEIPYSKLFEEEVDQ